MNNFEHKGASFRNTKEQEDEIFTWSTKRRQLLEVLGATGSRVKIKEVSERDRDVAPYKFFRNSVVEFIFPPQELSVDPTTNESRVIDGTPGYSLSLEDKTWEFDESKVEGHIRVYYDDADSRIQFDVIDVLGSSVLPHEVVAAIEATELTPVSI